MKKRTSIIVISASFAITVGTVAGIALSNNSKPKVEIGNIEEAYVIQARRLDLFKKSLTDAGDKPIYSKTFARTLEDDGHFYLSFAVAVDVTRVKTLEMTRTIEGKADNSIDIKNVYKGLKTSTGGLYYDSSTGELTSNEASWDSNYYLASYSMELGSSEAKDYKVSCNAEICTVSYNVIDTAPTSTSYTSMSKASQYRVSYFDMSNKLVSDTLVGAGEKAGNLPTGDPCVKWFNGDVVFDFNSEITSDLELHQKVSHDYKKHDKIPATCASTGVGEYYTCEHCDLLFKLEQGEYVEIDEIPVLPVDPNNHEKTEGIELTTTGVKTTYVIGDTFDTTNLVVTKKCSECDGEVITSDRYSIEYPTKDETSFVAADVGTDKEVTIKHDKYSAVIKVTVQKKANDITGFTNLEKHCGFKPFTSLDGVSATHGTIVYKFAETEDGTYKTADELGDDYEFKAESGKENKVFYYKAIVEEDDEFSGVEKSGKITVSHNFRWDLSDDEVDTFGCSCREGYYEFDKVVEGDAQEIVLTSDSKSISLSGTSYNSMTGTVKSIMIGEVSLGTSLDALDFTDVPATVYGEQTISVTVTSGEIGSRTAADHVIEVPVIIITDVIMNNEASIKKVFACHDDTRSYPITGYYVLGEDIDESNHVFSWYSGWDSGDKNKFSGIIDGRNHTVKSKSSYSGTFGRLNDATIKNMTITDAWYHNGDGFSLLGTGMVNSTLQNVTMKILANNDPILDPESKTLGWVCKAQFQNNTIKNCTFDASGKIVSRLFSTNNSTNSNTIVDSTFKCDQFYSLYKDYNLGEIYQMEGLTVEGNIYSTLARQTITIYEDKSTPSSISLIGDRFENATVNSIKLGKYSLGNDINALALSDEAIADESIRGDQNIFLNITVGEATFNYSVPVNVQFVSAYTEDTLETKQYLLTETETTSLSLAGTAYEGGTVESIKLGGEDLGTNLSSITLPSSIKNDKAKHGDAIADVLINVDGDKYLVHIPVLVVTKAINQYSEFSAIFSKQYAPGDWVEGSYILNADISTPSNVNSTVSDKIDIVSGTNITDRGFKGVFDGCGHKISVTGEAKIYNFGYFCALNGAILRNTTFDVVWNNGGIAGRINASTLENLTFNVLADTNRGYGIISAQHLKNNVCKNITINASGHSIYNLLGGYYDKNNNPSTFENVVVTAKEIKFIGDNSYWGEGTATMPEGITFIQEKDVVMNSQDLDVSAEKVSLSFAGSDYAGDEASVTSVKVRGYELGSNLNELVIPAALKSNKTLHGETTAQISLTHNGNKEIITIPVVLATAIITSSNYELIVPHGDADHIQTEAITGYYVIGEDFTVDDSVSFVWFEGWDSGNNFKFSGTVDGRNHKITSKSRYSGVFGNLYNATIKNLTVQDAWYHSYKNVSLFACKMNATTLENVTIKSTANVAGDPLQNTADGNTYGFVSRNMFMSNTLKNCTIDITTKGNFSYVFASNNCNDNTFADCEVICNQYFGLYKHYQTGNVTTKDGLTITGTTYTI